MSNLTEHAKRELEMAGLFNESGDFYKGLTGKSVMELIDVFEKQNHSGMSAPLVISLFKRLAAFEPLNPITGADDEWNAIGNNQFQNKRLSSVFKDSKNGKPYYIRAIIWKEENGDCFTGTVEKVNSRQYIKLPFLPKTFHVKVSSGDDYKIIDVKELDKAFDYYKP